MCPGIRFRASIRTSRCSAPIDAPHDGSLADENVVLANPNDRGVIRDHSRPLSPYQESPGRNPGFLLCASHAFWAAYS
jgi:hypothetical protein